jgi:hypothetical protein
MKTLVLALLLWHSSVGFTDKPSSNPADYPVTVHIVFSRYVIVPNVPYPTGVEQLQVVIDGQQVELQGGNGTGVLALGDYKAQRMTRKVPPRYAPAYQDYTVYRFLLPDGNTRDFDVVGLGPKA